MEYIPISLIRFVSVVSMTTWSSFSRLAKSFVIEGIFILLSITSRLFFKDSIIISQSSSTTEPSVSASEPGDVSFNE